MIPNDQKTSLLIPFQLPEFIRDDPNYSNFVLFLQSYYEWLEQTDNVTDRAKNLLSYKDIDETTSEFQKYFINDFVASFPPETSWAIQNKAEVIKLAKQLYQSKGTPSSYKFLFKVLYNSDFDYYNTGDFVLRASAGKWYVPRSLKVQSDDNNWLKVKNLKIFGEISKSLATIENVVESGINTEVFISDIERLFQTGEFVYVIDQNSQPVLFNGQLLRAKILGQISQLNIDPNNQGTLYNPGDPVIVYGGLNSNTGHGAQAIVGSVTSGSIQKINVLNGGYGYTLYPNTLISLTNSPGAVAIVSGLDPAAKGSSNITFPINDIGLKQFISINAFSYGFTSNLAANINSSLANAFSFFSLNTFPISSVTVQNGGGGISNTPVITATSYYPTDNVASPGNLSYLGILAPIQISNGGVNYTNNDTIIISGGSGYGAYANLSVNSSGSIVSVYYVHGNIVGSYPLGGLGYGSDSLPTIAISSTNMAASNGSLYVTGILGEGAVLSPIVNRVGSITSIKITDPGEDYISPPSVSLKVQDIIISNVSSYQTIQKGDIFYQGPNLANSTYRSTVDSISPYGIPDNNPYLSQYTMRVYGYNTNPVAGVPLVANGKNVVLNVLSYKDYGDGTAKATAKFLNGLLIGQGQYLDSSGQLSSFDVLQSIDYNNFTYEITVEKEIEKYRKTLLNLLHPSGMKVIGRFAMKSNGSFILNSETALNQGYPLSYFTGTNGSSVTMSANFNNPSNNIIQFNNLAGANLENIILPNSSISFTTSNGDVVFSQILSVVDNTSNTVTLADNVWLSFANVAYASANAGNSVINIISLTNSYNIVNGGVYTDPNYPLKDIIRLGDTISINNMTQTVSSVDYINNIVYLNGNLTYGANNDYISVNRTLFATAQYVQIFGPTGQQYQPELSTQSGNIITTQDGTIILLG